MFLPPQTISRDVGSFLNGDGGILCFGVRKTGVIYGEEINRKEEDNLRLLIDEIFKKMSPHVPTDTYRVTFTPVRGSSFNRQHNEATKLLVLEIRVAPGNPFALYEDLNHEVSFSLYTGHGVMAVSLLVCTYLSRST